MSGRIPFSQWRPQSSADQLKHYYANSDGVDKLSGILNLIGSVVPFVGQIPKTAMQLTGSLTSSAKRRQMLDSPAEKDRILKHYKEFYRDYTSRMESLYGHSEQELRMKLASAQNEFQKSKTKCSKKDTAGCRYMGRHALRVQWIQYVLSVKLAEKNGTTNKTSHKLPTTEKRSESWWTILLRFLGLG